MEDGALRRWDHIPRLAGARPSIFCAQCCEDFGQQYLDLSCSVKTVPRTFAVQMFVAKSSINAARIWFPEIGGMKNCGHAQSGICNWRLENWFGVINLRLHRITARQGRQPGKLMGSMTETSGARDLTKEQLSTLNLQRDQCFVGEVLRSCSG